MSARFEGGAGEVLAVLRDGRPRTKSELATMTGQSRSTISQRLAQLQTAGLVGRTSSQASTGGRPSAAFVFLGESQVVLTADIGVQHANLGVTNLSADVLVHRSEPINLAEGPGLVIPTVKKRFRELLTELDRPSSEIAGIGVGVPGPVEYSTGRLISPPIMPGWDGYDIVGDLGSEFDCPVVVDNDANVLAIGEHLRSWPDVRDLLYVKVGAGVGAGVILDGEIRRGALGAAGDIGHIHTPVAQERPCRCGSRGCVEAFAGGQAIANHLRSRGIQAKDSDDVVALVRAGDITATHALREAGRAVGSVLGACVAMLNPEVIVLGGEIAEAGESVIAGVREVVYGRALPLASQHLSIALTDGGGLEGIVGAAHLVLNSVFGRHQPTSHRS